MGIGLSSRSVSLILLAILLIGLTASERVYALPNITVSPASGPPGSTVTVTGFGFPANSAGSILFNYVLVKDITTNSNGGLTETITIPVTATEGTRKIIVDVGGQLDDADFTVTAAQPFIILTPATGTAGTSVTVKGMFFGANKALTIKFNNNPITPTQGSVSTNSTGGFTATIVIPTGTAAGSYTVSAQDDMKTASATFTVVASAITLSPTSGPAGTVVTINGVNFAPSATITIRLDGNIVTTPTTVTSSTTGSFIATITIPFNTSQGPHTVSASDGVKTETATFTVASAAITLSPTSGIAGSKTSVSGTNFSPTSSITIKFDTTTLTLSTAVTTTAAGSFNTNITIPTTSVGSHTVTASDATGRNATATFTVVASGTVTLSPTTANRGATVTIAGSNFNADSNVSVKFDTSPLTTNPTSVTTSASGQFTATVTIPLTASGGSHVITVTDSSGRIGTATITVAAGGSITITPTSGGSGTEVTISGSNFTANTRVTVKFGAVSVATIPSTIYASTTGTILATFDVPAGVSPGEHLVVASDDSGKVAAATFTVIGATTGVTLSPTSGPVGTVVTVTATSFAPNVAATIEFDSDTIETNPSSVITSSAGGFVVTITIPNVSVGAHTIAVTVGSKTVTATFTVSGQQGASITLSPSSGAAGTSVTARGSGFIAGQGITVNFDGSMVAAGTVNADGTFTIIFTVPVGSQSGSHTITANDGTNTASTTFSIGGANVLNVSQLKLVDQTGAAVARPSQGMQVLIQSDLGNSLSTDQQFAYIVQVKDSEGSTIMISWMTGTLPAGKQYAVAQSWLAEQSGNYTIDVFVWQSVSNPVVLAPVSRSSFTVS